MVCEETLLTITEKLVVEPGFTCVGLTVAVQESTTAAEFLTGK